MARCRAGLVRLGVGRGDRVAAYLPNIPEAVVALLATASLGAIWSSCAPEFGTRSVVDRLRQIEPVVLLAVDGYRYGAKAVDRAAEVAAVRAELPSLRATVTAALPRRRPRRARRPRPGRGRHIAWDDLLAEPADLLFVPGPVRPPALRAVLVGHHRAAEADRARPRRHPRRAPQGAGPAQRPGAGRPLLLVLDHRLDDVELPGVGPAGGGHAGAVRWRPRPPRPGRAVAHGGRRGGHVLRHVGAVPAGVPQGRRGAVGRWPTCRRCGRWGRPGRRCRPRASSGCTRRSATTCCCRRSAAAPTCALRSWGAARWCRCGRARSRAATWAPASRPSTRTAGRWWASRASW